MHTPLRAGIGEIDMKVLYNPMPATETINRRIAVFFTAFFISVYTTLC